MPATPVTTDSAIEAGSSFTTPPTTPRATTHLTTAIPQSPSTPVCHNLEAKHCPSAPKRNRSAATADSELNLSAALTFNPTLYADLGVSECLIENGYLLRITTTTGVKKTFKIQPEEEIGHGSFSKIFVAENIDLPNEQVAIKKLNLQFNADLGWQQETFHNEINILRFLGRLHGVESKLITQGSLANKDPVSSKQPKEYKTQLFASNPHHIAQTTSTPPSVLPSFSRSRSTLLGSTRLSNLCLPNLELFTRCNDSSYASSTISSSTSTTASSSTSDSSSTSANPSRPIIESSQPTTAPQCAKITAIVMDYYPNHQRLSDFFENNHHLSNKDQIKIILNIINKLIEINSQNIIHGDLRADNILINPNDLSVVLIDFGYSKVLNENGIAQVTKDDMDYGIWDHFAPENNPVIAAIQASSYSLAVARSAAQQQEIEKQILAFTQSSSYGYGFNCITSDIYSVGALILKYTKCDILTQLLFDSKMLSHKPANRKELNLIKQELEKSYQELCTKKEKDDLPPTSRVRASSHSPAKCRYSF